EEKNMTSTPQHIGYQGTLHAEKPKEDAYVVFKVDAPRDIRKVTYGGRLYNRAPGSHIDFLHSFDDGQTWTVSYSLTEVKPPWDVIEYVTVDAVPAGTRSVLFKYLLNGPEPSASGCSIYAVRMEVNHDAVDPGFKPLEVTFTWDEVQLDRSHVERSHTQLVTQVPFKYVVNTAGDDQPVVKSLRVNTRGAAGDAVYGYSDGQDTGGEKYVYRRVTYGKNFLEEKPYTLSTPPTGAWGGDDPDCKKLTNGIVGPNYAGGISSMFGGCWDKPVEIVVDIGKIETCGAFRIHTCGGYPWWEALKGEVKDEIEVLTSVDGKEYVSHGMVNQDLRLKDVPINHFMPDDMSSGGWNFELIPENPVKCRYVKFKVTPRRTVAVTEVQALEFIKYEPFDLRVALPDEK
ncbi:MAG TPA: hypothetical protein VMY39_03230, partial [Planctomycetota bacterium]|nr:hypothetical protein [Planctomycetota bacterium]